MKKPKTTTPDKNPPPTFTLDANDTAAPALIRMWAANYFEARGGRGMLAHEHEKYLAAHEIAIAMERWHRQNTTGGT